MFTTKTAVLAAGLIVGLPFAVQAADLYTPAPTYPDAGLALVSDTFTGFYAGGNVGVATSDEFDWDNDTTGFNFGAQAGYLQQLGMFVVGAELEAAMTNDLQYALTPASGLTQDWTIAAKARAGVALDHTLVYGTVGYGWTKFDSYGAASVDDDLHGGIAFGGGVEQAFNDSFSVRGEYLQTRYDEIDSTVDGFARTDDLVNHAFKLGANFRF